MSINTTTMRQVKKLSQEVCALIATVEHEMYESDVKSSPYPSKTTGELRRRSMDLTRALAELRR